MSLQDRMIYFPERYPEGARIEGRHLYNKHPKLGDQYGILIEPGPGRPPTDGGSPKFYLVFNGNAATAAGVAPFFRDLSRATGCSFLLVDYRGYGFNEGRLSEAGVTQDILAAYDTMQGEGRLAGGVGVIGHSLGGAAAIALAGHRPVDRLVVLSTFTSIDAMAREVLPWPIHHLAVNQWPNDERLAGLVRRPASERPAMIALLHGRRDEVVPFRMGEELAKVAGNAVRFVPVADAHHNDIFEHSWAELAALLSAPGVKD